MSRMYRVYVGIKNSFGLILLCSVVINNTTTMVESVAGLAAWVLLFFAASPRLPLRKGLTEGGVVGFN
jgi:hypothetical protein